MVPYSIQRKCAFSKEVHSLLDVPIVPVKDHASHDNGFRVTEKLAANPNCNW